MRLDFNEKKQAWIISPKSTLVSNRWQAQLANFLASGSAKIIWGRWPLTLPKHGATIGLSGGLGT